MAQSHIPVADTSQNLETALFTDDNGVEVEREGVFIGGATDFDAKIDPVEIAGDKEPFVPEWAIQEFWKRVKKQTKKLPEEKTEIIEAIKEVADVAAEEIKTQADKPLHFDYTINLLIFELELRLLQEKAAFDEMLLDGLIQEDIARRRKNDEDAIMVIMMGLL